MTNKHTWPSVELLKRKAKLIRKTNGITHTMALDIVALDHGFRNWKHYIEGIKLAQLIPAKLDRLKRPSISIPAVIDYHDVLYGRIIGQRPNRKMSVQRHKKVGKILTELLEETIYHKQAYKILFQIRIDLDRWLGYEYDPSVMGNAEFNTIYYCNHTYRSTVFSHAYCISLYFLVDVGINLI